MNHLTSDSNDEISKSDSSEEDDDLIYFSIKSIEIDINYQKIIHYSKYIKNKYLPKDLNEHFPDELERFQDENDINLENIALFFNLIQQNFKIKEDLNLSYNQYKDLANISEYLQSKKFSKKIQKYTKFNTDFIIQQIHHEVQAQNNNDDDLNYNKFQINKNMEEKLTENICECFLNEKFIDLPISIIFRIVEKCFQKQILNNELYDFIIKSIPKLCVLFQFLDLQIISEDRLYNLCNIFSKSGKVSKSYFRYLPCNLILIKKLYETKESLKKQVSKLKSKKEIIKKQLAELEVEKKINDENQMKNYLDFENQIDDLKKENKKTKKMLDETKKENNEIKNKLDEKDIEIKQMNKKIIDLELQKKEIRNKFEKKDIENKQMHKKITDLESQNNEIRKKLVKKDNENKLLHKTINFLELQKKLSSEKAEKDTNEIRQLKSRNNELESQISKYQKMLAKANKESSQLKNELVLQYTNFNKNADEIQNNNIIFDPFPENHDKHKKIDQLQMRLIDKAIQQDQIEKSTCMITGKISATSHGLYFNAVINLVEKGRKLDTLKSKYIISTNCNATIGKSAYIDGEPIKLLNMTTIDCAGKAGTYYVRAIVYDTSGEYTEIISNPVNTTNTRNTFLTFTFQGRKATVLLASGDYKLEVWGADGGSNQNSRGGKGGYSTGCITLHKMTKIYVFVGGHGSITDPLEGSVAEGGFPDGGSTICGKDNAAPGSGGGSSSIRISSCSLYARVIVAGGGGGAVGWNSGGYGGGIKGGNGISDKIVQNFGAGTQTGSTGSYGISSPKGIAGKFGEGGVGCYIPNNNSAGGGGGGWYGGGGGDCTYSSSGGGGSGWVFNDINFNIWKAADPNNKNMFKLSSKYFLSRASTYEGNKSFPAPICQNGNGIAKITPL